MRLRNIPRAAEEVPKHPCVIQNETAMKGSWNKNVFQNDHPLHIEIGMGKGQFILALAKQNPDINYIGIERYTSVLLRGLEKFDTEEWNTLTNIRFICMDAATLPEVFAPEEIDKIYLNFSDPWPKARHAKRRLTSTRFFSCYDQVLKHNGIVEFKTDNITLFDFSLEQVVEAGYVLEKHTHNLHHDPYMNIGNIMTEYEAKFSALGNPICKLIAKRK